jgi:hemolysin activation/secretion protein
MTQREMPVYAVPAVAHLSALVRDLPGGFLQFNTTHCSRHIKRRLFSALFAVVPLLMISQASEAQALPTPATTTRVRWNGLTSEKARDVLDAAMNGQDAQQFDGAKLDELCRQLTEALRRAGFLVAQVVVTDQDRMSWRNGEPTMSVFEGKVGAIKLHNTSRVADARLMDLVTNALCPGGVGDDCVLDAKHMERAQLLLEDMPGVGVGSIDLSAEGVGTGQTAVNITTTSSERVVSGNVGADNYGIPSAGANRLNVGTTFTDLFHFGDVLQLTGVATDRHEYAGGLQGSVPLGSWGLRGQVGLNHLLYALPQIGASGTSDSLSTGIEYPLLRGLAANWTVELEGVGSISRQDVDGVQAFEPRKIAAGRVTLSGNAGDGPIQSGASYWSNTFAFEYGHVSQDLAGASDPTGQLGNFSKLNGQLLAKLDIGDSKWYLIANIRGQLASTNLDASEKLSIGGSNGVRAYRTDEGSLDSGILGSLELRYLYRLPNGDQLAAGPIFDYANGVINQHPYAGWQVTEGYVDPNLSNHRSLASWGLGADFVSAHGYSFSLTWSNRLPGSADSANYPGSARNRIFASVNLKL